MNARFYSLLCSVLLPGALWGQLSLGSPTLINDHWAFVLGDVAQAHRPEFDDSSWQRVDLPHDWSAKKRLSPELASSTGYLPGGIGWYRKNLAIPSKGNGGKVFLYFEGIYNRSEVYFNGHLVGKRPNGYVSFYYDVTPYVRFDEPNSLAVRVDHSRSADSRWYTGSGIYRNVFLVRAGPVHIAPWGVFVRPQNASGKAATLMVDAEIQNETDADALITVHHELLSASSAVVANATANLKVSTGGKQTSALALAVSEPHLWSVDDPYLYELKTTVVQEGRVIDQTTTRTGIRHFSFDPDKGFFLNGLSMKMKGVCLHHDAGVLGAAVPRSIWRKRLQTLKSLGCNAVRTSHNPQAPDLYDLCDELGLLVLNEAFDEWEFPKRKWLRGWNVGEPGFDGSYDFFAEWSGRDIADMVRRDRNHPSIFAWSIGNEVDYPNDPYSHPVLDGSRIDQPVQGGYKPDAPHASRLGAIAKRLAAEVKKHDQSRPVTAALAGVVMANETAYPGALDLVGYNYTEDRYRIDHEKFPKRIIYGSENRHTRKAWSAVEENPHIFGQFLWTGIDYLGEAGPWPARGSTAGLLDLNGSVKPRGRFREALWSSKPVIHLGTEPAPDDGRKSIDAWPDWNYKAGQKVRVLCYTNAAKARLLLNGMPVGGEKPYDRESGVIAWDIPFQEGRLEAIGLNDVGAEVSRAILRSAGAPAAMQLEADDYVMDSDGGVAAVSLQIVDQNGVAVTNANHEVTCTVEGPARLLGLEAANNRDMSDYSDAVHPAFRGRLIAYVRASGAGSIRVKFAAAGLPDGVVTLTAQ
jgi:beta-galactosidase